MQVQKRKVHANKCTSATGLNGVAVGKVAVEGMLHKKHLNSHIMHTLLDRDGGLDIPFLP